MWKYANKLLEEEAKKEEEEMRAHAEQILKQINMYEYRNDMVNELPYGLRKMTELGRTLMTDPKMILLDEPAAGMNPNETAELMQTIRLIRERFQMTILLIEHDMRLVSGICERLTVLNFGSVLCEGETSAVLRDPEVVKAYLGE